METLLIAVTVISLALAMAMSVVAWTLLRNERRRAAARIEALEALAFTGTRAGAANTPAPRIDVASDTPEWDAAFRGFASEDEDAADAAMAGGRTGAALPEAMFGAAPASNAGARKWLVVAAIGVLIAVGYATASAMRSPGAGAPPAAASAQPTASSQPSAAAPQPLELLSLRHSTDANGAFAVSGFVQNPAGGRDLTNVEAVVYLFDANDQYFMTGRAPLEMADLKAGTESSFDVRVPGVTNVGRYRVGFRQPDGVAVGHLDKRGQLPDGTSETVTSVQR